MFFSPETLISFDCKLNSGAGTPVVMLRNFGLDKTVNFWDASDGTCYIISTLQSEDCNTKFGSRIIHDSGS